MNRLALGVAALLVTAAGSGATAAPGSQNGRDGGDWCEKHSDAGARPEVDKRRPLTAGGGNRDSKVPHAFACYEATASAADQDVYAGSVVNAWVDNKNGAAGVSCVPQRGSTVSRRCNYVVPLPGKAEAAPPGIDVDLPSEDSPGRVVVDDGSNQPTASVDVKGVRASIDIGTACLELDRTPVCRENLGGE
ncbi:MAG: hypothetical protein M3394_07390 [Actinomycetota bacterium]|nr:hypothetical protein [Actinomycetota bacterium]